MGWFNKKKYPAPAALPAEDRWDIAQGESDGKPMLVRRNCTATDYAGHPELPTRLGIAVPLRAPDENGFPGDAEGEQLAAIEDRLFDALGSSGRVVLIISTGGMREFVSYVRTPQFANQVAQAVRATTKTHEIQHYAEDDPQSSLFGEFA